MNQLNQINPYMETPLQQGSGIFRTRYSYYRASEIRRTNDCGQDYFVYQELDHALVFALCDGVSMSFFGEVAAQLLAHYLVECFSSAELQHCDDQVSLQRRLHELLTEYTVDASRHVAAVQLPQHIPDVLREVLEEKRNLGSEATFVCGRIDLPGTRQPRGRLMLCWLGDSRLRVWGEAGEITGALGNTFHTSQRWSTRRGCVGHQPHVHIRPLISPGGNLTRLVAYSDGLSLLDDIEVMPQNDSLADLIRRAASNPASDDIALLEIAWGKHEAQKAAYLPTVDSAALPSRKRTHAKARPSMWRRVWEKLTKR